MDMLKDIYADFFEDGSKRRRPDRTKGSSPEIRNKQTHTTVKISSGDALKNAQDAIKEAHALFDNAPTAAPVAVAAAAEQPEPAKQEPETDPEEELDALIGLEDIKHDVRELADFAKVQKLRKEQGMKSVPVSLHLVFTGNPGTGKTTVARILGRMYRKIGILSKGQLIEVDRSGLVAGYVGQTALKVQKVIQSAMGGVLFIDEAYALAQENDSFGQEAIDTLLKAMEDHRDDLIVIIAGYTGPMEGFINSNPGLKSRFNKYIEFPDYTVEELEKIFYLNCSKYEYVVDEDAKNQIRTMILLRKVKNPVNFANGREVRNMFEEIITNQARRVAAMENPGAEELRRVTLADLWDNTVQEAAAEKAKAAEAKEAEKPEAAEAEEPEKPETAEAEEPEKPETAEVEEPEKPEAAETEETEKTEAAEDADSAAAGEPEA